MNEIINLIVDINERKPRLRKYRKYYEGVQRVKFVGAELQFEFGKQLQSLSCNRCEVVVDAVLDKLAITGFEDKSEESNHEELAKAYWDEHNMDTVARQVHQEALIHGDAYVIVWPNEDVEVFAQHSDQFAVMYDDEYPDKLYAAAKSWKLRNGKWRVNIYYEDRLEKYVSRRASDHVPDNLSAWEEYSDPEDASWPILYDFGRVPVFHFAVNARSGEYGRSDLHAIIPMQDSLNRTLANQAVAEEFQSYKQRWATGIQPIEIINEETGEKEYVNPFEDGADRLWTSTNAETRFGQFDSADLRMFEEVVNGHELRIARTARIPLHYFTGMGDALSGEALKTVESPFIDKVKDRARSFGITWDDMMNFILRLRHGVDAKVEVVWKSPESRLSDKERAEVAMLKQAAGVSKSQTLRELEYSDEQIEGFQEEQDELTDERYPQ
jgi:hypothetical protein